MINITALGDLHGNLPVIENGFDLMLICGDVCPLDMPHYLSKQKKWMVGDFANWVKSLPFKTDDSKIFMVFGNHDFFECASKDIILSIENACEGRLSILNCESRVFECDGMNISIFGSPWNHRFFRWPFTKSEKRLKSIYKSVVPEKCDIFISHDAPAGEDGLGTIHYGNGEICNDVGGISLAEILEERTPKYFLCSHIHTGNHTLHKAKNGMMCANVSIVDEECKLAYTPLEFIYDVENK